MYRYLNGSYILFKANNKSVFIIRLFKLHAETKYKRSNMLDNFFILTNQSGCFIYSLNYFNCIVELFFEQMKHNLNIFLLAVRRKNQKINKEHPLHLLLRYINFYFDNFETNLCVRTI